MSSSVFCKLLHYVIYVKRAAGASNNVVIVDRAGTGAGAGAKVTFEEVELKVEAPALAPELWTLMAKGSSLANVIVVDYAQQGREGATKGMAVGSIFHFK